MASLPKKYTEAEKESIKKENPPFIARKAIELNEYPEINDQPNTKIEDFSRLYFQIWKMSNKDYQEKHWVRQEPPVQRDNFDETTEVFEESAEAILNKKNPPIEMTAKQREMLARLLYLVEEYNGDPNTPLSRYGENDAPIVGDPRWDKIRQYAKLVYEELSGDDLDAWERARPKQAKPLEINRKKITEEEWTAEKKKIYPNYLLQCEEKVIGNESLYCFVVDMLFEVWEMSNQGFQERFWVRKEHPLYDNKNCAKSAGNFYCYAQTLIGNEKYLTPSQSKHLQKLCDLLEDFQEDPTKPEDPGYGLNDAEIIKHPKWQEIREHAKQVYKELTDSRP